MPFRHRIDPHAPGVRQPDQLEQLAALALSAGRGDEALVEPEFRDMRAR
jgi:hypothetical protein